MLDAVARTLHRARPLMTEDTGKLRRHDPGDDRKVGMADPAGRHAHQNLVPFRVVEGHLFHSHELVVLVADSGPHRDLSSRTYRSVGRICAEERGWQPQARCAIAPAAWQCAAWRT